MPKRYWLMKTEPDVYSIDDLERQGSTPWEGVRNYQARNTMRDDMKVGDLVLFYHSNAKPPGVAGIARVSREGYPDHFAWDESSKYFDKRSTVENPVWMMVDVEFEERFADVVSLEELKEAPELDGMHVTRRGQRLSVQEVEPAHFQFVRKTGRKKKAPAEQI